MSKIFILLAITMSFLAAQNPIPVPGLNATGLDGEWWVQWQYFNDPNLSPASYSCYHYNITVGNNTLDVHWESLYSDQEISGNVHYTTGSTPAQWFISPKDGYNKTIVAYDYLHHSWFLIGDNDYEWAMLFARVQSSPNPIQVNVAINLLIAEGYSVTQNCTASYDNTNCGSSFWI